MRLSNLHFPGSAGPKDVRIAGDRIAEILPATSHHAPGPTLHFTSALVFPGLINSHDHLDFNLFPQLGSRIYNNYREWGPDIHRNNRPAIRTVLQVPQELRTLWGIYKNLLNGFTTVVNHGERLPVGNQLIDVFQDCHNLHSVGFQRRWRWRLNRPGATPQPFALHVGEGTDETATREIDRLIRWNLFRRPLIGIHGVAMTERQAPAFRAIVWCPASNYFLLDKTAPVDRLKTKVPILFGTDSTLTASWNSWTHIRMARRTGWMTDAELLETLTSAPATAWGLKDKGTLAPGFSADLVIARLHPGRSTLSAFFELDPEDILLILHRGNIRLFDPSLLGPLNTLGLVSSDFHQATEGGKYVSGDLPGLMRAIRRYYPGVRFPALP